jgi:signal transduction histidine kinase
VRWAIAGALLGRARALYFTLLAGIVAVTTLGWVLLSRLVVRPLARLGVGRTAAGATSRPACRRQAQATRSTGRRRRSTAWPRRSRSTSRSFEDRVMAALSRVRKAEQHLAIAQRLAATGKLASGIAHEINNPLGGMRSAVKALQRGDLDEAKTVEYLELVQDGLARVEETVKKVLQFTPRTPTPRATDLRDVAHKAGALARHRLDRHDVRYVERLPDGPVRVYGDAHELQQVALNLLLNAADAIPPRPAGARGPDGRPASGLVELSVREDGDTAVIEVTDDGVGMTPEVQAQCFDLFFSTKEVGEGTGLGLAVVHNIVTNHGGRIDLESAPGKGTRFRVILPRDAPVAEPPPAGAPPVAAAGTGGGASSAP